MNSLLAGCATSLTVVATTVVIAAALPPACSSAGLTVAALHGPNFYIDTSSNPVLRGAYAGHKITDSSGNGRTDL